MGHPQPFRHTIFRDLEGRMHALSSVSAACETDQGTLLMMGGGRMVHVPQTLETTLMWLERRIR